MGLLVVTLLSFFGLVLFIVHATGVVSLVRGVAPLPDWVRPLFSGRQGGRVRFGISLAWGVAMVVLSQLVVVAAFIDGRNRDVRLAELPPLLEVAVASAWSYYLARRYAGGVRR